MSGTLFVVATPIGNLGDITARALRVLREVTLVAAEDTRRTHRLLSHYAITTPTTSLHEHNEGHKLHRLIERLQRGDDIAVVSDAGTPTISDPGQRLVRAAIDAAIRVEPIPGPSATVAALAASGMAGSSFVFLGFPPTRSKDRNAWFDALTAARGLVVFFEAPHRIRGTLEEVLRRVGDVEISLARELTKIHEEFLRGPLSEVLLRLDSPQGEFTAVLDVGHKTKEEADPATTTAAVLNEFGLMTINKGLSKRKAIGLLARKYGISTNVVYDALEAAKK
jgi:16S rRNA (cytidine1402-2'-O)-methyltransferase